MVDFPVSLLLSFPVVTTRSRAQFPNVLLHVGWSELGNGR